MTPADLTQDFFCAKRKKDQLNGAIAQLGEHLPCTQGVSGSIPLSSTTFSKVMIEISDLFRLFISGINQTLPGNDVL